MDCEEKDRASDVEEASHARQQSIGCASGAGGYLARCRVRRVFVRITGDLGDANFESYVGFGC